MGGLPVRESLKPPLPYDWPRADLMPVVSSCGIVAWYSAQGTDGGHDAMALLLVWMLGVRGRKRHGKKLVEDATVEVGGCPDCKREWEVCVCVWGGGSRLCGGRGVP